MDRQSANSSSQPVMGSAYSCLMRTIIAMVLPQMLGGVNTLIIVDERNTVQIYTCGHIYLKAPIFALL